MNQSRKLTIVAFAAVALIGIGCGKKVAMQLPAPPAPPVAAVSAWKPTPAPMRASTTPPAPTPAPKQYPNAATRARIDELLARIEDAYFDYDKATIRPDAVKALQADSTELRTILAHYPDYKLTVQGHCDERGSEEYNIGLGDRRAAAAEEYLVEVGIPSGQLSVISYGKERPVCTEHNEACWQKNRRIHIVAMAQKPQS
jgi:peptidoglycan-associated lipoprotein